MKNCPFQTLHSSEQTHQQFPHGNINASEAQMFEEFAFCKKELRIHIMCAGCGTGSGAMRASRVLPGEMGSRHRAEVWSLMARKDEIQL